MGKSRKLPKLKIPSPFTGRIGFSRKEVDVVEVTNQLDEFSEALRNMRPRYNSHWRKEE
jgi:hypothetical protein